MRRTLISTIITFIVILAVSQAVHAEALSVGGGITLTESAAGVSMGSRFDACRKIAEKSKESGRLEFTYKPIASWFSQTGMMPFLVMSKAPGRPVYRASADFNNVNNIQKVELTPDHGLTTWEATNVALKGYQVEIPFLDPGGYAFEWRVTSRDEHKKLIIIFIPISWNSTRSNSVVQQIMVQSAPEECWNFTDEQWVSMLSPAFQPATALPDPGYLAKRAAQQQTLRQMAAQPVPDSKPQPAPVPKVEPEPEKAKVETVSFDINFADGGKMTSVCLDGEPYVGRQLGVFANDNLIGVVRANGYKNGIVSSSSSSRFLREYQDREKELRVEWLDENRGGKI